MKLYETLPLRDRWKGSTAKMIKYECGEGKSGKECPRNPDKRMFKGDQLLQRIERGSLGLAT